MPGLIDVHVHLTFGALTMEQMMSPDFNMNTAMKQVGQSTEATLMRGFTSVRDVGGPIFPLKAAVDKDQIKGPRIWPSVLLSVRHLGMEILEHQMKNPGDFLERLPELKS
jgi:imidazolonepropionase-like amidohydrolase